MPIVKLYPSFPRPKFYQPPDWRYRREGTRGQNPKPKNAELAEDVKTATKPPAFAAEEQKGRDQSGVNKTISCCFKCGKKGHFSRECTQKDGG